MPLLPIKPLIIRIKYTGQSAYEPDAAFITESRCLNALIERTKTGSLNTLYIQPQVNLDRLKSMILKHFNSCDADNVKVYNSVIGARDGRVYMGLTVYFTMDVFPEHTTEVLNKGTEHEFRQEVFNWVHLINNYGGELIDDMDGDTFEDVAYNLGHEIHRDNTFNYAGASEDSPEFICTADYSIIEGPDSAYLSIMFHHGGDVRGNYSSKYVFKFDSIDDLYSVVYPAPYSDCEVQDVN